MQANGTNNWHSQIDHGDSDMAEQLYAYMPQFSLDEYNQVKDWVFKTEQRLLRLIRFDFQKVDAHNYKQTVCIYYWLLRAVIKILMLHK